MNTKTPDGYVTADDLYQFALTTGALYDRCVAAARATSGRKARFVAIINEAWTLYKREVNHEALITSSDMDVARILLEHDRVQHVAEMDTPTTYKPWQTYVTACKRGRITYHPDWDSKKPWASFINGTAGAHFADPASAAHYYAGKGMTLVIDEEGTK